MGLLSYSNLASMHGMHITLIIPYACFSKMIFIHSLGYLTCWDVVAIKWFVIVCLVLFFFLLEIS
jgi:hypothetical protein